MESRNSKPDEQGLVQGALFGAQSLAQVISYFLVFVPTIREIRDFYREMQRTNRESINLCRHSAESCSPNYVRSDYFRLSPLKFLLIPGVDSADRVGLRDQIGTAISYGTAAAFQIVALVATLCLPKSAG
eukprot:SAG31_NODE_7143_length_1778_cov_1.355569_2_plen_130_part_00